MEKITRRQFLEESLLATAAAAAAATAPSPVFGQGGVRLSANETLRVAVVGCRIRGKQLAREIGRTRDCAITYVCDPDREVGAQLASEVEKQQGRAPRFVEDLRRIFDDRSVDVVVIAAPNHWHALAAVWAMQAGKDVYVEKPVSHNVSEGRRIVQVARKTGRICQTGTQRRSNGAVAAAVGYVRQGKLGEVKLARSIIYGLRNSIGGPGKYDPPANVDYNLWAGPARLSPLIRPQFHYDWHWFWETGNGELGNNNIHMVDVCRWALGLTGLGRAVLSYGGRLGYADAGQTPNTQVVIHDFGDRIVVQEVRGLKSEPFHPKYRGGCIFYGSKGIIADTSLFDLAGNLVQTFTGAAESHFANFVQAVRSRKKEDLTADIEEGHQSSALCHIGNIAYRLGRPASPAEIKKQLSDLKTHDEALATFERTMAHLADHGIDPEKTRLTLSPLLRLDSDEERFRDHARANALLTREYRKPFVVPGEKQI